MDWLSQNHNGSGEQLRYVRYDEHGDLHNLGRGLVHLAGTPGLRTASAAAQRCDRVSEQEPHEAPLSFVWTASGATLEYRDATDHSFSLGNVGVDWLIPAALLLVCALGVFRLLHVRSLYQLIYFVATLGWSFLMFSYLHDGLHIDGYWMERNRWLKGWFVSARSRHEIHHHAINDQGLMDRNFGIGFFFFDRLFGTLCSVEPAFNDTGYKMAQARFSSMIH